MKITRFGFVLGFVLVMQLLMYSAHADIPPGGGWWQPSPPPTYGAPTPYPPHMPPQGFPPQGPPQVFPPQVPPQMPGWGAPPMPSGGWYGFTAINPLPILDWLSLLLLLGGLAWVLNQSPVSRMGMIKA